MEEYLKPLGLGQLEAAKQLGISLDGLTKSCSGSEALRRIRRCDSPGS
jgi:hypothetical protein